MGTKHKHYDVIVAWAAGEEIEYKEEGGWYPLPPLVPRIMRIAYIASNPSA